MYAKRTLEEAAEVDEWNEAVKARALELVGEIASDTATSSGVATTIKWLAQRGGEGAKSIIIETIKSIGSEGLKSGLRSAGLHIP